MRIIYFEYTDFLTNILSNTRKEEYEDDIEKIVKRSLNPAVKEFKEDSKRFILDKYLKKYEAYEKSFFIR